MATTFYLPASGARAVTVAPSAASWTLHINAAAGALLRMVLDRIDTALATIAYNPDAADHLVDGSSMAMQYVSDILPPQVIAAQRILFGARCLEAVATNNLYPAWKLYAVTADGATPLGDIVPYFKSALAEMATALTGYAEVRAGSALTLNVPFRLVLEIGASGLPTNTATDTHNHSWAMGDPMATGAANCIQQADTTAAAPELTFSTDLITKFQRGRARALVGI
jgi:hypothetical protein